MNEKMRQQLASKGIGSPSTPSSSSFGRLFGRDQHDTIESLKLQIESLTEERNFFRSKYSEQLDTIRSLERDVKKARGTIDELRTELVEERMTAKEGGQDSRRLSSASSSRQRTRRRGGGGGTSSANTACSTSAAASIASASSGSAARRKGRGAGGGPTDEDEAHVIDGEASSPVGDGDEKEEKEGAAGEEQQDEGKEALAGAPPSFPVKKAEADGVQEDEDDAPTPTASLSVEEDEDDLDDDDEEEGSDGAEHDDDDGSSDATSDDDDDKEEEEEEEVDDVRAQAARMLIWANYQTSRPRSSLNGGSAGAGGGGTPAEALSPSPSASSLRNLAVASTPSSSVPRTIRTTTTHATPTTTSMARDEISVCSIGSVGGGSYGAPRSIGHNNASFSTPAARSTTTTAASGPLSGVRRLLEAANDRTNDAVARIFDGDDDDSSSGSSDSDYDDEEEEEEEEKGEVESERSASGPLSGVRRLLRSGEKGGNLDDADAGARNPPAFKDVDQDISFPKISYQ